MWRNIHGYTEVLFSVWILQYACTCTDHLCIYYNSQVCKLFRHIATNEQLVIAAEHNEFVLKSLGPLVSKLFPCPVLKKIVETIEISS